MKFATVATGGIGGYLAVRLARAGEDVACLARGAHLEAIRTKGVTLESADGVTVAYPRIATDDPTEIGPVDVVIFGVKAKDVERAAESCIPLIGPETAVIPFLNGVETVGRLATVLPESNIANGIARISTTISSPGLIRQVGEFASFTFAERDSTQSQRIKAIRKVFEGAGIKAPIVANIDTELWLKFCLFASMSGVTAVGRCTVGDIRRDPHLRRLFQDSLAETTALIHHCGKDGARGARGHSSLRAAVDTEIELTREGGQEAIEARTTKQRDMPTGKVFAYRLQEVTLGIDADGDAVTTCVVEPCEPAKKKTILGPVQRRILDSFREYITDHGRPNPGGTSWPEMGAVSVVNAERFLAFVSDQMTNGNPKDRRKTAKRALDDLFDKSLAAINGGKIWLV